MITKVIPLEILESDVSHTTFAYMGKEYGFYIQKIDKSFYVLLIDFVFEPYSDSHREFIVGIEPVLQQCFRREKSAGKNVWVKSNDERHKLYVSNPRFAVELSNANSLNYRDEGYSKTNDDGMLIWQTQFGYSGISSISAKGEIQPTDVFKGKIKFGLSCNLTNKAVSNVGALVSEVDDLVEKDANVWAEWKNKIIDRKNFTEIMPSKTQQRDNPIDHYLRSVSIVPTERILLSAEGSYAETIVLLDETNCRSRFLRLCKFDIVSVDNVNEPLTGPDGEVGFAACNVEYLFNDKSHTVIGDDFGTANIPVYLLPQGDQLIDFTPSHSGEYSFQIPAGTVLELQGESKNSFSLEKGTKYTFRLINNFNQKIIAGLSCSVDRL